MRDAVRSVTDPQVPIAGTQMGYGGMLNLETHADLDYQDNHFYIDHYNFPHTAWDARDWRIRDTSAVGTGMSSILNMAASREAGRPYTVSEYNQPYPNRQAAELDPVLAAFGAFQGWDAIMHFAYSHGRSWDDPTPSSFDINGDWTKWPNVGQSAWLFRSGAIAAGKSPVEIPVSREVRMQFTRERRLNAIGTFLGANGVDPALAFVHPIGIRAAEKPIGKLAPPAAPYTSDTGELVYDKAGRTYIIRAAKAAGAVGYFRKIEAGAMDVELVASDHGFATILLTALDDRPLAQSRRMLLSTPGYTLGTGQKLALYADTKDWWTFPPEPGSTQAGGRPFRQIAGPDGAGGELCHAAYAGEAADRIPAGWRGPAPCRARGERRRPHRQRVPHSLAGGRAGVGAVVRDSAGMMNLCPLGSRESNLAHPVAVARQSGNLLVFRSRTASRDVHIYFQTGGGHHVNQCVDCE